MMKKDYGKDVATWRFDIYIAEYEFAFFEDAHRSTVTGISKLVDVKYQSLSIISQMEMTRFSTYQQTIW